MFTDAASHRFLNVPSFSGDGAHCRPRRLLMALKDAARRNLGRVFIAGIRRNRTLGAAVSALRTEHGYFFSGGGGGGGGGSSGGGGRGGRGSGGMDCW